jgi:DNA-directed RNA polymerase specialized sigma24 family protein
VSEAQPPGGPDEPDAWEQACARWGLGQTEAPTRVEGESEGESEGDAADGLEALPEAYAMALRLRAEGLDDAAIGRVLGIEDESVGPLLTLAQAKLAKLEGRRDSDGER